MANMTALESMVWTLVVCTMLVLVTSLVSY
jgi:hypothetical protein